MASWYMKKKFEKGGSGGVEGDLENCAYLWKNPGYAPVMGALILSRLINTILTAFEGTLNINSVFSWLDSQISLWWI